MSRARRSVIATAAAVTLTAGTLPLLAATSAHAAFNYNHLTKMQKRLLSGNLAFALNNGTSTSQGVSPHAVQQGGDQGPGADGYPNTPPSSLTPAGSSSGASNYTPSGTGQCSVNLGRNIKVNQNCLNISDNDLQGRAQANNETSIAEDPFHPTHLVASDNNYVRGDGTCGAHYSVDGGRTWNDSTVPNGFTRGGTPYFPGEKRQYWQAGGDTSVAWDTKGNSYLSCQLFNRGKPTSNNPDQSSAFAVYRSTGNNGASWNFPGRYVTAFNDSGGSGAVLEDKQLLTVDNHKGSPFQDRVYVSWTEFAADGTAYIYEAYSSDYGGTFSPRVLVSKDSPLCTNTFGAATPNGKCNANQFSDPFTGSDGNLYVVWANFNNTVSGNDNRNQMLLAKSTDGGNTFSTPIKASDYYDLPDCATYQNGQDAGRACVPEKSGSSNSVFRATNYPSGAVDPRNPNKISISLGSYINKHSNEKNGCVPTGFAPSGNNAYTGVKTPGACNNDILLSTSKDSGTTFSGASTDPRTETTVTQDKRQATTDQFWQWEAYTANGTLAVSYMDRQYGNDETNGFSDFSLSGSRDLTSFGTKRVTSSSMPPPTEFSGQFYGDYTGLTAHNEAHPFWSDTRSPDLFQCIDAATGNPSTPPTLCTGKEPNGLTANDEDVFSSTETVPTGSGDGQDQDGNKGNGNKGNGKH